MTRHGKPAGVLLPLSDPQASPLEIRRKLYLDLSARIARQLDAKGVRSVAADGIISSALLKGGLDM